MAGPFRVYKHFCLDRKLSDFELRLLCGAVVHDLPFAGALKPYQLVKPVQERRIKIGRIPETRILKMTKKKYVDAFFSDGLIQLGSFHYFNSFDHGEIGDATEGVVTVIGKTPTGYMGGKYGYGYNNLLLCAYAGEPDATIMRRFGYDSAFIITNPHRFGEAIASTLHSAPCQYAVCKYSPHKALIGYPGTTIDPEELSHRTAQLVKSAKYFIKPDRYSHQKEFRFAWEVNREVKSAEVVACKEARQWCARL